MYLHKTIQASITFLPDSWKETYGGFLEEEHLTTFSKKMEICIKNGIPEKYPLPRFDKEITIPYEEAIQSFKTILTSKNHMASPIHWAQTIQSAPFEHLLIIIGQRWTASTLKNEKAIPPLKKTLLNSCTAPFNDQICCGSRAWEKHIDRCKDQFWGEIKGNSTQKGKIAHQLITKIIENKTWWNIFYHHKHGPVYEIRVSSGHGIRWNSKGTQLIGFLEPFL